ncbi:hypothetical protein QLX67_09360 [Balneolaceae bacterium ANBcel3]|nr:hypothetical protein [Balneolaceae bacterium ANBcel3]
MILMEATSMFDRVIDVVTVAAILLAAFGLYVHIRSNHLTVMHKCMADYRRIIREIQSGEKFDGKVLKLDLLGLFNEQLFYMNRWWYLPREIKKEWENSIYHHLIQKDEYTEVKFNLEEIQKFPRVLSFFGKKEGEKAKL